MPLDFKKFLADAPAPSESYTPPRKGKPVRTSPELQRILDLPRRPIPSDETLQEVAAGLKHLLGTGATTCECVSKYNRRCCKDLKSIQAWALWEIAQIEGLAGAIGVGHGKTILDLLAAMVMPECKTAVLLVPPALKHQLLAVDWHFYGQHWQLPNLSGDPFRTPGRPMLYVLAYSQLSGTKNSNILEDINPDLIIADEAHSVARRSGRNSARAGRLQRFLNNHPECRFLCWSGTLTKRELEDHAEFFKWALKERSPLPTYWPTVMEWGQAVNPSTFRAPFGELERFGSPVLESMTKWRQETLGVVTSADVESCQASLLVQPRKVEVPLKIKATLSQLEETWDRPDGEEKFAQAIDVADCARELSAGFYHRWKWPRGEPKKVIDEWLEARKEYNAEVRAELKRPTPGLDSPALLWAAAERWHKGYKYQPEDGRRSPVAVPPHSTKGPLLVWESEKWPRWQSVEHTARPETEAVWVDDYLVRDAAKWLEQNVGVCWYLNTAWGAALEKLTGLRRFGAGEQASIDIANPEIINGSKSIIASVRAHGTGKNLQMFSRALVIPLSSGDGWEQLLGRHHRDGQLADEVTFDVYAHTVSMRKALDKARELALYIQTSFGAPQKLVERVNWLF